MTKYIITKTIDKLPEKYLDATVLTFIRIDKLPDNINECAQLQSIIIRHSFINNFNVLNKLKEIEITSSHVMINYANVEKFYIYSSIVDINELNYSTLKDFKYVQSELTKFPSFLRECLMLESLTLFINDITEIPDWISELDKLSSLDVRETLITTIPTSLKKSKKLEMVYIDTDKLDHSSDNYQWHSKNCPILVKLER